jgi:hypothetical protein
VIKAIFVANTADAVAEVAGCSYNGYMIGVLLLLLTHC